MYDDEHPGVHEHTAYRRTATVPSRYSPHIILITEECRCGAKRWAKAFGPMVFDREDWACPKCGDPMVDGQPKEDKT